MEIQTSVSGAWMELALSTKSSKFSNDFRLYCIVAFCSISLADHYGQGGVLHPITEIGFNCRL